MDPLGTLANVLTLFEFSVKLKELVSRWKDAPEHLRQLEQSVSDMMNVLRLVTDKSEAAVAPEMEDRGFMNTIGNLAKTCSKLVKDLNDILLSLDKTTASFDGIRYRLTALLKERDMNDKRGQIQEYTAQLTLLVASLNSKQSTRIEASLDVINRKLDDALTLPPYPSLPEDNTITQEESSQTDPFGFLLEDTTVLTQDGEPSLLDGLEDVEIRNMKEKVGDLKSQKMFHKAAKIQQGIIKMVKSQVDLENPDDICDLCVLQEQHADLLLECSTPARLQEATVILSDALTLAPSHAQGRLMSKLAKLYQNGDALGEAHNPKISKNFFTNSIRCLSRANPFLPNDFLAVGAAMIHFHETNSEPGLAREIKKVILDTMKQKSPDFSYDWTEYATIQEESVLGWCKQQGFSAHQLRFRFDTIQSSDHGDASPLHLAIQDGEKEIVEKMLVEVDDMDFRDSGGMTPLLSAAWKRQSAIAQVLLKYGASTELRTPDGETALHLCLEEDSKGGVKGPNAFLIAILGLLTSVMGNAELRST